MDINIINKMNEDISTIENLLMSIESQIQLVSPNTHSTLESKGNILDIITKLAILKEDLALFRSGKSIMSKKDILKKLIELKGIDPSTLGYMPEEKNLPDMPNWDKP